MEFLKQYWPMVLVAGWLGYKWYSFHKIKKMIPGLKKSGAVFIDVRSPAEYQMGHAEGSVNIPLNELSSHMNQIPQDKTLVVACASGTRSGLAKQMLKRHGHKTVYNAGNWTNMNEK